MTSNKYNELKKLLSRFVEQANKNVQNKENRKTTLGIEGFENNNFRRQNKYDIVYIDETEYHVHLFNSGSYGPTSGRGRTKLPFIDYLLPNGNWANIRTNFRDYQIESLQIIEWITSSGKDRETGISYNIADLDLFSEEEPNAVLKEFLDKYLSLESVANNLIVNNNVERLAEKLEKSKKCIILYYL